jgi:hypothetical protein
VKEIIHPGKKIVTSLTFVENIDNEERMWQNKTAELQHVTIPLTAAV